MLCSVQLTAVTKTISQRSLKKNELIYFINYFFLKKLSVNLFKCLHLETNSSRVLTSDSRSNFMIDSFSVKHRSYFLVPSLYRWALQAKTTNFSTPRYILRIFLLFLTFIFKISRMVVVTRFKSFLASTITIFSFVYIWPIDLCMIYQTFWEAFFS